MKQNFAGQPDGGGALGYAGPFPTLTGRDLRSDISTSQSTIFRPYPRFVDNCKTKNCKGMKMKNFDDYSYDYNYEDNNPSTPSTPSGSKVKKGGSWSWGDWSLSDLFNTAGQIYTTTQQNAALKEQGNLALQIEAQKAAQQKALAAQKATDSSTITSKIKAYTTPIIIVGVLSIGGIAAYFYFKKKKIS